VLWVVVATWGFAVLVALVIGGFCGYEIAWKSARLRRDLAQLDRLRADLTRVQARLLSARQHASALRSGH
jgi:hypothetical protein